MATAASTLIQRVRRYVQDWPDQDNITASLSSSATAVTVADSTLYSKNFLIQIDQEAMLVRSINSTTSLTVARAAQGSTAASHALSASVLIRPAFTDVQILDSLSAGIQAAFPLIYKPTLNTSLSASESVWEYTVPNMPGTSIPIQYISTVEILEDGDTVYREKRDWIVKRGSTPTLKFKRDVPGGTIRIHGYGPFPFLTAASDTLDALWPTNLEFPLVEYAAARLLASGEAGRVRQDTGSRDDREAANRPGSAISASNQIFNRWRLALQTYSMPPLPAHIQATF